MNEDNFIMTLQRRFYVFIMRIAIVICLSTRLNYTLDEKKPAANDRYQIVIFPRNVTYLFHITVLHTTVGPTNVYENQRDRLCAKTCINFMHKFQIHYMVHNVRKSVNKPYVEKTLMSLNLY